MKSLRGSQNTEVILAVKNFEDDFNLLVPNLEFKTLLRAFPDLKASHKKNIVPFYKIATTDGHFIFNKDNFYDQQLLRKIKVYSEPLKIFEKADCYFSSLHKMLTSSILLYTFKNLELIFCTQLNYQTIFDDHLSKLHQEFINHRELKLSAEELNFFERYELL